MATNLRLSDELAAKLRAESGRTGQSQQEVIRRALEAALSTGTSESRPWRAGARAPRRGYAAPAQRVRLSGGVDSAELLERDDRL